MEKYKKETYQKIFYKGKDKKKIEKIFRELSEAEYIGYDGDMCCRATTERGAFIKFKRKMKEDCGEIEAMEMDIKNVGTGWLFLPEIDNPKHQNVIGEDADWFVGFDGEERSEYELFVYQN